MESISSRRALLLNASYEPMKIISWQRAIVLWFQEKAEIVEYHSTVVRSVRQQFTLPSIIRLKTYVRQKRTAGPVRFSRENVYTRDNHTCQYCREQTTPRSLTLDHVIPASRGGPKTWTNVVTSCRDCNQKKGNRTPKEAKMPLLNEPKAPEWLPQTELLLSSGAIPSSWLQYLSTA